MYSKLMLFYYLLLHDFCLYFPSVSHSHLCGCRVVSVIVVFLHLSLFFSQPPPQDEGGSGVQAGQLSDWGFAGQQQTNGFMMEQQVGDTV